MPRNTRLIKRKLHYGAHSHALINSASRAQVHSCFLECNYLLNIQKVMPAGMLMLLQCCPQTTTESCHVRDMSLMRRVRRQELLERDIGGRGKCVGMSDGCHG